LKEKLKNIIEFFNDDIVYFAASLSFFTIFSLLPILALLIFVMSTNASFASQIDLLMTYVYDFINPTHSQQVIVAIENALENIGSLGNVGLIYLFFIFFMFFKDYEYIINKIHNTQKRTFIPMILLYVSFLIIVPFSLITITFVMSFVDNSMAIKTINIIFTLIILTFIFKISVNKIIQLKAAFLSAALTLAILKLTQELFVYYITYNTTYATIYGALSSLLFMFLWIYFSWIVYLYGIKVCYLLNKKENVD
jgi:membrane protein